VIKFGIQTPQEGFTFEKLKNIWLECEKLGFASAWLYDHMQPIYIQVSSFKEPLLESWTTLSALATIARAQYWCKLSHTLFSRCF